MAAASDGDALEPLVSVRRAKRLWQLRGQRRGEWCGWCNMGGRKTSLPAVGPCWEWIHSHPLPIGFTWNVSRALSRKTSTYRLRLLTTTPLSTRAKTSSSESMSTASSGRGEVQTASMTRRSSLRKVCASVTSASRSRRTAEPATSCRATCFARHAGEGGDQMFHSLSALSFPRLSSTPSAATGRLQTSSVPGRRGLGILARCLAP